MRMIAAIMPLNSAVFFSKVGIQFIERRSLRLQATCKERHDDSHLVDKLGLKAPDSIDGQGKNQNISQ